ncbi:hypothetical protein [Pseudomonas asplenii]|uniref:hypothetical protein n=1 Tax=Pseudomonas asplenii TaxID=53407 RepID=UPI0012F80167|nr:hypothetical protein [Pseudomonas fuscovaginae]
MLDPPSRMANRPGGRSTAAAGQHANLGDVPGAFLDTAKPAGVAAAKSVVPIGDDLSRGERDIVGAEGPFRGGPAAPVQGVTVEEGPAVAAGESPESAEVVREDAALRVVGELSHGIAQTRSETLAPLAQPLLEGAAEERTTMSGQQEEASPQSWEQDEETSTEFLQVPFSNERAQGRVLVSRDGTGEPGLLIRASGRQVFEQLAGHFDQARQPHWRLGDVPGNDGTGSQ